MNKYWTQARLVVYTGTLTSGVNFTKKHFHENVSCFTNKGGSASLFTQSLMRCRNLIDNKMTIYIQKQPYTRALTTKMVYDNYTDTLDKYKVIDCPITSELFNL